MATDFEHLAADVEGFGLRTSLYLDQNNVKLSDAAVRLKFEILAVQESIKEYVSLSYSKLSLGSTANTFAADGLKREVYFALMKIYKT